ncbi:Uu.00g093040.m01.CDS01 [Anthostomella pinea]|uniref:Uu.00g093040.m01.CDS01 n=1 Tax=Anthostomella pinea TaxID=933095 RepID=A0AAI8YKN2_9PEZI|nr:Uu.00g093040.m01.CDS01 [Anthostomella pinea]
MASAHAIQIKPDNTGMWQIRQSEPAAKKATDLLQKDFETHHCFFNSEGFHNHISHHILALYGTGASPEDLEKAYDDNASYQRSMYQVHEDRIEALHDWEKAKQRMGKEQYYTDFLVFFQREIQKLGWEKVLDQYMFKGDERSEDMLIRMHGGFLHPLIQLMYGVEWQQPAIVAMALAQAAVHEDNLRSFLLTAEEASKSASTPMPSIASLLDVVKADEKLATAAILGDSNKVRDGVLTRARDEIIRIAGQVKIKPEELDERTVEMYNTAIYEGAAAAIRPGKDAKFDFFLIHHINVCPIYLAFNKMRWVSTETKVRLLEWKIRMDLIQYAARACAPLSVDKITSYVPRDKKPGPAIELLPRIHSLEEDGHVVKLFRAIGVGQNASKEYEDKDWMKIKGDLWTKIGHMVFDGAETPGPTWIRGSGDPDAWKEVHDRAEPNKEHL